MNAFLNGSSLSRPLSSGCLRSGANADDSAVRSERSRQLSRRAEARSDEPRGGGGLAALMRSEGSEPSGALSPERWGWGPTASIEERGESIEVERYS